MRAMWGPRMVAIGTHRVRSDGDSDISRYCGKIFRMSVGEPLQGTFQRRIHRSLSVPPKSERAVTQGGKTVALMQTVATGLYS